MRIALILAGCLYGGALFFKVVFGWHIWVTVPSLLLMTGLYTIGKPLHCPMRLPACPCVPGGGLDAIVFADVIQTGIFTTGGLMALYYALSEVGGFTGLYNSADEFNLDDGYFTKTWRPMDHPPYTGPGLLTGMPTLCFWYWVVDQEMAQRVLGAQSVGHARVGALLAASLKMLTPFIIVIPGECCTLARR